jgi:hypothetical protein
MLDPADLEHLEPSQAWELGRLLQERASRQLRKLTVDEVRSIVQQVQVSDAWASSDLVEIGRIRAAAKELVLDGHRPAQFAEALAQVGLDDAFPDGMTIALAISEGIKDGLRLKR